MQFFTATTKRKFRGSGPRNRTAKDRTPLSTASEDATADEESSGRGPCITLFMLQPAAIVVCSDTEVTASL